MADAAEGKKVTLMNLTPIHATSPIPWITGMMEMRFLMAEYENHRNHDEADTFLNVLEVESSKAEHSGRSVALIFIRIAQLEDMARHLGELYTLNLLREIDLLIRVNIRCTDREFIYGKNEFMLILPDTTKEGARQLLFKLRRIIENFPAADRSGSPVRLVPRFGISSYP
jgi:diguanylate cyclase (GGDEF)-like protein